MHITIITPGFNQLDYLKRAIASIRDQVSGGVLKRPNGLVESVEGSLNENPTSTCDGLDGLNATAVPVAVHHHIQDGGSTDGTVDWLRQYPVQQPSLNNYQLTLEPLWNKIILIEHSKK